MSDYIGEIRIFAGARPPAGFVFCAGQILPVQSNEALYSVIGTRFGGSPGVNFRLPNLQGMVVLGASLNYQLGASGGSETVQLSVANLPPHNHQATFTPTGSRTPLKATVVVNAGTGGTATNDPTNAYWGKSPVAGPEQSKDYTNQKGVQMASDAVQVSLSGGTDNYGGNVTTMPTGSGYPFSSMQPYVALNYIICVNGLYPSPD